MNNTFLKKRIIPKLLIKYQNIGQQLKPILVTTKQYMDSYEIGDAVSQAKIYEAQMADELIVLNINASSITQDNVMLRLVEKLADETFMPLSVGGGVNTITDFSCLLDHGADKVCINSSAIRRPEIITEAANQFGSQCVVVSIDFFMNEDGIATVFNCNVSNSNQLNVLDWAKEVVQRGAGEILLTDVKRDGTGTGLNYTVASDVRELVQVPIILSGGCGLAEHFVEGFQLGQIDAIAAGTYFCFRDQNLMQVRAQISNAGIRVRMEA